MTKTQAIGAIRAMGISARSLPETGEIKISRDGETYYTDCAKDAFDTATLWTQQSSEKQLAEAEKFYCGGCPSF